MNGEESAHAAFLSSLSEATCVENRSNEMQPDPVF